MIRREDFASPKLRDLPPIEMWKWRHDREDDVFSVTVAEPRPAVSVDVDGHFWIRIHPETGEVYGFEFEDFESVFLQRHANLATAWRELNQLDQPAGSDRAAGWLTILHDFIVRTAGVVRLMR